MKVEVICDHIYLPSEKGGTEKVMKGEIRSVTKELIDAANSDSERLRVIRQRKKADENPAGV